MKAIVPNRSLRLVGGPEDQCPNLVFDPCAETPDEAASTRIALSVMRGDEKGWMPILDGAHFNGLGGDAA